MPKKIDPAVKERALRMVAEHRGEPASPQSLVETSCEARLQRDPAGRPRDVAHGRAETLIAAFRSVRSSAAGATAPTPQPLVPAPDLADQIRKLSELRDAGILTEQEFNAKKADLLARM